MLSLCLDPPLDNISQEEAILGKYASNKIQTFYFQTFGRRNANLNPNPKKNNRENDLSNAFLSYQRYLTRFLEHSLQFWEDRNLVQNSSNIINTRK